MRAAEFVERLAGQGVRLSVEGGDLKFRGPRSALTPKTLDRLKAHKAEVIAYLRPAPERPLVKPPKVTPAALERVLADPPRWLEGSYLWAYRSGRFSVEQLALGVGAELRLSAYDDDAVAQVARILRGLGYRDSCAPPPFERNLTEFSQGDERSTTWT